MTAKIIKLPFSHRVAARRPRRSKNGTPEERAAKAHAHRCTVVNLLAGEAAYEADTRRFQEIVGKLDPRDVPVLIAVMRTVVGA